MRIVLEVSSSLFSSSIAVLKLIFETEGSALAGIWIVHLFLCAGGTQTVDLNKQTGVVVELNLFLMFTGFVLKSMPEVE